MLVARPGLPAANVKELIDYAKKNPGKLNYGSVGAGGVNHLAFAWFNTLNGLEMQHVPYKGLVQGLQDVTTDRLDTMFAVIGGAAPHLKAGQDEGPRGLRPVAQRADPDVPTFTEAGLPNFDASFYFALAAPAGTPRELLAKFAAESGKIVTSPEFKEKFLGEPRLRGGARYAAGFRRVPGEGPRARRRRRSRLRARSSTRKDHHARSSTSFRTSSRRRSSSAMKAIAEQNPALAAQLKRWLHIPVLWDLDKRIEDDEALPGLPADPDAVAAGDRVSRARRTRRPTLARLANDGMAEIVAEAPGPASRRSSPRCR